MGLQRLRQRLRLRRGCGDLLQRRWALLDLWDKRPHQHGQPRRKALRSAAQDSVGRGICGELLIVRIVPQLHGGLGIDVQRPVFLRIADQPCIRQGCFPIGLGHGGDPGGVEHKKHRSEIAALAQYGGPRQAGLESFQGDALQQAVLGNDGAAPLVVVVVEFCIAAVGPRWSGDALGVDELTGR